MKYVKLTLQYMKHNILYLLLFSLIPSVLIGLLTDPASTVHIIKDFDGLHKFSDIFGSVSELNWKSFLLALIIVPIILVFFSASTGLISKHMRRGVFSMNKFFRRVNNNILYLLVVAVALLIAFQLNALLVSSFTILWIKLFKNGRVALTLTICTGIIFWLLLLAVIAICVLWLPTMTITGLNPIKALAESFRMSRGKIRKILTAVVMPLLPYFAIVAPLSYFDVPARQAVYVLIYLLIIPYYIVLMYATYCDVNDIDREDLRAIKFKKQGISGVQDISEDFDESVSSESYEKTDSDSDDERQNEINKEKNDYDA